MHYQVSSRQRGGFPRPYPPAAILARLRETPDSLMPTCLAMRLKGQPRRRNRRMVSSRSGLFRSYHLPGWLMGALSQRVKHRRCLTVRVAEDKLPRAVGSCSFGQIPRRSRHLSRAEGLNARGLTPPEFRGGFSPTLNPRFRCLRGVPKPEVPATQGGPDHSLMPPTPRGSGTIPESVGTVLPRPRLAGGWRERGWRRAGTCRVRQVGMAVPTSFLVGDVVRPTPADPPANTEIASTLVVLVV
jgi:hypothetical protein